MRKPHHRSTKLLVATLAVSLVTACGSTVQTEDTSLQGAALAPPGAFVDEEGNLVDAEGNPIPVDEEGNPILPDAGGVGTGPTGGGGTGPGGSTPSGSTPSGTPAPNGPEEGGLDDVEGGIIEVGITYAEAGGNAAIGAAGITQGDGKARGQAMVDYVNETGGIAGKKLKAVFASYDATSPQSPASQDQAACAQFFEDNDVAIVWGGGVSDVFDQCALKAGALVLGSGTIIGPDAGYFSRYPNTFSLSTFSIERIATGMAGAFGRNGYYDDWSPRADIPAGTKLGLLTYDDPTFRAGADVMLAALEKAGHPVADSDAIYVRLGRTTAEAGGTAADVNNAVLRFSASRVTHVVMLDPSAVIAIFFAKSSDNQNYYPRWGIGSGSGLQVMSDQGLADNDNLGGAVGMNWLPNLDLPRNAYAKYRNSESARCLKIIKDKTGAEPTSTNEEGLMYGACDQAFVTVQALRPLRELSLSAALDALNRLGTSYTSPLVGPTIIDARHHDTARAAYDAVWDSSCRCQRYTRSYSLP